jgi:hypothetical protein
MSSAGVARQALKPNTPNPPVKRSFTTGYNQVAGCLGMILGTGGLIFGVSLLFTAPGAFAFGWLGISLLGLISGTRQAFSDNGIPKEEIATDKPEASAMHSRE